MPTAVILQYLEQSIADLRLSDDERRELAALLKESTPPEDGLRQVRNRAFAMVRERLGDADVLALLKWLEGVAKALDAVRAPPQAVRSRSFFSPGEACRNAILHRLRSAATQIEICVFTLSDDRIAEEIMAAHRRGVAVRLITDNDKTFDAGSDVDALREAGIAVAIDRSAAHMHHKFALFDRCWLLNGSYNWTRSASLYNEENLIETNDPALLSEFARQFDALWRQLQG